jgi:hypothetical protein
MSYTLRGRLESRLAALVLPLAVACALAGALRAWWPVELAGLMGATVLALDLVYHRPIRYQPGWAALPLGALELGCTMALVYALGVRVPLGWALVFFGAAWLWALLLSQAVLPFSRLTWGEDGGELGRAGGAAALAFFLPFVGAGGVWWHGLPPTIHLAAGIHQGPLVIDRRERLVGDKGAIVRGGIVVRHSDVTISHVRVLGGENGIAVVDDVQRVVLDHVSVAGARLDGIHVRHASVAIRHCNVDMRGIPQGQGIDVSYGMVQGENIIERCTVVGGRDGIVAHGSMAMIMHNDVQHTTMTGISLTEMSMGSVERNTVRHALGIGILCGDRSMCDISRNAVAHTMRDDAGGNKMRAGFGLEVEFESQAELSRNDLGGNPRSLGVFLGSVIHWSGHGVALP